ncbi:MAG TPA: peptidoglycan DD-metalloendopeptidase family protein [Mariprofundaceae bacterium]|nr:peptidoglycan DD-metalloendopeptidase family protein [Mariprofundaceae bacterium]
MLRALTAALMLLIVPAAHAQDWQAMQGDVVKAVAPVDGPVTALRCFGKRWPVKQLADGRWHGWVGVDLKQRPGSYDLVWQTASGRVHDRLQVAEGHFRISRITVEKKMAEFDAPTLARIRREVAALVATYSVAVDANPAIVMQQPPTDGIESTPFGAQRFVNGEPRAPHSGIDIAAPEGSLVVAPLAGRVLLVADMYLNGNTVVIGHGNGLVSVYSHLESTPLRKGDWVETGARIGLVGMTGRATGPHLHWGIRFNQARINPDSLLATASP